MTVLLTLYLAGMPSALVVWMWTIWGLGDDEDAADTMTGIAAGGVVRRALACVSFPGD